MARPRGRHLQGVDERGEVGEKRSGRRPRRLASNLLLVASLVLGIAAVVLFVRDRQQTEQTLVPPTAEPGKNDLVSVANALKAEGLKVEYGRGATKSANLDPPGQLLDVEGTPLYVFVYPDVASREAQSGDLDPASIRVTSPSGRPVEIGTPHLSATSNVIVLLAGGSTDLADRVDRAVARLA